MKVDDIAPVDVAAFGDQPEEEDLSLPVQKTPEPPMTHAKAGPLDKLPIIPGVSLQKQKLLLEALVILNFPKPGLIEWSEVKAAIKDQWKDVQDMDLFNAFVALNKGVIIPRRKRLAKDDPLRAMKHGIAVCLQLINQKLAGDTEQEDEDSDDEPMAPPPARRAAPAPVPPKNPKKAKEIRAQPKPPVNPFQKAANRKPPKKAAPKPDSSKKAAPKPEAKKAAPKPAAKEAVPKPDSVKKAVPKPSSPKKPVAKAKKGTRVKPSANVDDVTEKHVEIYRAVRDKYANDPRWRQLPYKSDLGFDPETLDDPDSVRIKTITGFVLVSRAQGVPLASEGIRPPQEKLHDQDALAEMADFSDLRSGWQKMDIDGEATILPWSGVVYPKGNLGDGLCAVELDEKHLRIVLGKAPRFVKKEDIDGSMPLAEFAEKYQSDLDKFFPGAYQLAKRSSKKGGNSVSVQTNWSVVDKVRNRFPPSINGVYPEGFLFPAVSAARYDVWLADRRRAEAYKECKKRFEEANLPLFTAGALQKASRAMTKPKKANQRNSALDDSFIVDSEDEFKVDIEAEARAIAKVWMQFQVDDAGTDHIEIDPMNTEELNRFFDGAYDYKVPDGWDPSENELKELSKLVNQAMAKMDIPKPNLADEETDDEIERPKKRKVRTEPGDRTDAEDDDFTLSDSEDARVNLEIEEQKEMFMRNPAKKHNGVSHSPRALGRHGFRPRSGTRQQSLRSTLTEIKGMIDGWGHASQWLCSWRDVIEKYASSKSPSAGSFVMFQAGCKMLVAELEQSGRRLFGGEALFMDISIRACMDSDTFFKTMA